MALSDLLEGVSIELELEVAQFVEHFRLLLQQLEERLSVLVVGDQLHLGHVVLVLGSSPHIGRLVASLRDTQQVHVLSANLVFAKVELELA